MGDIGIGVPISVCSAFFWEKAVFSSAPKQTQGSFGNERAFQFEKEADFRVPIQDGYVGEMSVSWRRRTFFIF